jgi:hypothetical protein
MDGGTKKLDTPRLFSGYFIVSAWGESIRDTLIPVQRADGAWYNSIGNPNHTAAAAYEPGRVAART